MKKRITILGSTGSIGTQALEVLENIKDFEYEISGLACNSNVEKLILQIEKFRPKRVFISDFSAYKKIKEKFKNLTVLTKEDELIDTAIKDTDLLVVATSGKIALKPTIEAIKNKIDIALANKEILVMAGEIVMELAKKHNVKVLPVDSEHSAVLQASKGDFTHVHNLIITASGGPFLNKTEDEIYYAKAIDALKHPNWNMGKKITIDSATLMNKGLEVIEAHHFFNFPYERIKIVVHPESIVHSAIEMVDGSIIAQIGNPKMYIPIQYAMTYPDRVFGIESNNFSFFDKKLTFKKPDYKKFPCLKLALDAGIKGGIYPCVLNAANEVLVYKFLRGEICMGEIARNVEKALTNVHPIKNPSLYEILEADEETRASLK